MAELSTLLMPVCIADHLHSAANTPAQPELSMIAFLLLVQQQQQ